jgi:hypothetical protein
MGTHESLIAKAGHYADLVRTQEMKTKRDPFEEAGKIREELATDDVPHSSRISPLSIGSTGKLDGFGVVGVKTDDADVPEDERRRQEMLRVVKESKVPLLRILKMQRPEAGYFVLAMFVAIVNGAILPCFGVSSVVSLVTCRILTTAITIAR